jgi:hypothetical protein
MMLSYEAIASKVKVLYSAWSKKYRADFRRVKPETYYDADASFVNNQIKFIGLYLEHMLVDSMVSQNYGRIKRFLSRQKVLTDRSKMVLRFIGGTPPEIVVIVKNLDDVDMADVYGITHFQRLFAIKGGNKRWTCKNTKDFIKVFKNDLAFDGLTGKFDYEFDLNELIIDCSIKAM